MLKIIALAALALLALAGAVLEGLIDQVSPQLIQFNGLLIILCAGVFAISALKFLFVDREP